jgi:hypothetical protein
MDVIAFLLVVFFISIILIFFFWRKKELNNVQFFIALSGWIISLYLFSSTPIYIQEANMAIAAPNRNLFNDYLIKLIPTTFLTCLLIVFFGSKKNK